MYSRPKRIYTNLKNLENYIEGEDVYNSLLLFKLQSPNLKTTKYTVKTPYRPDLIAEDFYGDIKYEPFVILQLRVPINFVVNGLEIDLITKQEIENILNNM